MIDAASFVAYGEMMRDVNDRIAAAHWISIAAEAYSIEPVDCLATVDVLEAPLDSPMTVGSSLPAQLAVVRIVGAAFELPPREGIGFEAEQERQLFEHGEAGGGSAPWSRTGFRGSPDRGRAAGWSCLYRPPTGGWSGWLSAI